MSTFAAAFREIVTPDLRKACHVQGLFLALDRKTFSEAFTAVASLSFNRGASRLPDNLINELHDWIAANIVRSADEFRPAVEERRQIADRVARDIADCEAQWVTT